MAECQWCGGEMLDLVNVTTCSHNTTVLFPEEELPSIPFGKEDRGGALDMGAFIPPNGRCHDCNVEVGSFHHPGCDVEECPKCKGRLISCGCLSEEEEDEQPTLTMMEDTRTPMEVITQHIARSDDASIYIEMLFEKVPEEFHKEIDHILTLAVEDPCWKEENKEVVAAAERHLPGAGLAGHRRFGRDSRSVDCRIVPACRRICRASRRRGLCDLWRPQERNPRHPRHPQERRYRA